MSPSTPSSLTSPRHPTFSSAFTGTLQTQLVALLEARNAVAPAPPPPPTPKAKKGAKKAKGKNAPEPEPEPSGPSLDDVENLSLPASKVQSTILRPAAQVKKLPGGGVAVYCRDECAVASVAKLSARAKASSAWSDFVDGLGEIPRADRRCMLLAAKLLAGAVAGGSGSDAARSALLLQSDDIAALHDRDSEAAEGVEEAVSAAWPHLHAALKAAFGQKAVKALEKTTLIGYGGDGKTPGMATEAGYAALCGAAQLNCLTVKVPNPLAVYAATTPEAAAAPTPMRPAVMWLLDERDEREARRVEEEERVLDADASDDSDDDFSDSDEEGDDGDDVVELDWGAGCEFDTSLFPPLKGAAVFPLVSGINHSCDPNCEVAYVEDNGVMIVARRPVAAGEELTISYVDPEMDDEDRREELEETYGFECACPKCAPEPAPASAKKKGGEGKKTAGAKRKAAAKTGDAKRSKVADEDETPAGTGCAVM